MDPFLLVSWLLLLNAAGAVILKHQSGANIIEGNWQWSAVPSLGSNRASRSDKISSVEPQNILSVTTNTNTSSKQHEDFEEDCFPWMFLNETKGKCECCDIPYRAVLCEPTIPRTSILDCYCMTYSEEKNETELGRCLYGCGHREDKVYYTLPRNVSALNAFTCNGTNKDSALCGACKPGFSPLVYSYEMKCMNCTGMTYNWIKYIAVAYIPLTFFFFFVVIFRFSGTHPLVRSFIFVCQGIVSPVSLRAYLMVVKNQPYASQIVADIVGTIYGIWNLDFFRIVLPPICLDITSLQVLALDYAIAVYPLLLVVVTYIIISLHSRDVRIVVWFWRPFHKLFNFIKQEWNLQRSVVEAFATFILLSYLKFINVTMDFLVYTDKYILPLDKQRFVTKQVLFYDASVEYFAHCHLYYGIAAIFVGIVIVILPLVFLVLYPMQWFQKCLNVCQFQRQSIEMIVNRYQGYYKDGTNGTKDCRFFSITFFLIQIILYILYTLSRSMFYFPVAALIIT